VLDAGASTGFFSPLPLARQGYQVTTVGLSVAMLQILSSQGRRLQARHRDHERRRCKPAQASPSTPSSNAICCGPCPPRDCAGGLAGGPRRLAAPGGRLAVIEGFSGGTGRPLSPRVSMKHPSEPRAVVTDAQKCNYVPPGQRQTYCRYVRIVGREDVDRRRNVTLCDYSCSWLTRA